jgi:hypothetical protein
MSSAPAFVFVQYAPDEKRVLVGNLEDRLESIYNDERWGALMTRASKNRVSETGLNYMERLSVILPRFPVVDSSSVNACEMQKLVEQGVLNLSSYLKAPDHTFADKPLLELAYIYTDLYFDALTSTQRDVFSFARSAFFLFYDKVHQLAAAKGAPAEDLRRLYIEYTMESLYYVLRDYSHEIVCARVSQGSWSWPVPFCGNVHGNSVGRYELIFH